MFLVSATRTDGERATPEIGELYGPDPDWKLPFLLSKRLENVS